MTAGEGLLDTSTLLLLPRIPDPDVLPEIPFGTRDHARRLSVGPLVTDDATERALSGQAQLQEAEL